MVRIELLFEIGSRHVALFLQVLAFQVVVVEFRIEVLMVVNPRTDHVGILLNKLSGSRLSVEQHRLVVPEVVSCQSIVAPKHHLAPQVRVRTALVHRCVRLKVLLYVQFVFLEGQFHVFGISIRLHDTVEVPTNTVLLIVESV